MHPLCFDGALVFCIFFFFQAEDGIRDHCVTGVQTCALPILMLRILAAAAALIFASSGLHAQSISRLNSPLPLWADRSEERRVGKECRSRWWPDDLKKNKLAYILCKMD